MNYREPSSPAMTLVEPADEPLDDASGPDVETRLHSVESAQHGERLDRILVALAPEFSRSHLQTLVAGGHVRVDGAAQRMPSKRLKAGQAVALELVPTAESLAFQPEPMSLAILHEDDDILVLDKPAGLVVHPAPGNWSGTLLNGLLAHHVGAAMLPRAGIVHRLDKDTSGVMIVGKTLPAVTALVRDIAARQVGRLYLALCHGEMQQPLVEIDAAIGRDPASRVKMAVVTGAKPARTDVERLAVRDGFSALRCTLHTGRTHQIRVHLAWKGHPLVSDPTYGGKPALGLQRQGLHATRLAFEHPVTRQAMAICCPPPDDFVAAWLRVAKELPASSG